MFCAAISNIPGGGDAVVWIPALGQHEVSASTSTIAGA